jgi:DNA repair protein RecO (recombination protein O)
MSGIAKGAQRSLKRFLNRLELFTRLEIIYTNSRSSSLVMIDQAELIDPHPQIRADYERYTAAALICELTLHWTRENDPDPAIFDLLAWALKNLEDLKRPASWGVILFQIKMLTLLGYKPDLSGCSECGTVNKGSAPFRFSKVRNGMICNKCSKSAGPDLSGLPFSIDTTAFLQKAQEMPLDKLNRLHFTPKVVREAIAILKIYGTSILQRDITAWDFLVK